MVNWATRYENRLHATHLLKVAGIQFETFNDGAHLKIGKIDFWPGTGLWIDGDSKNHGVEKLIEHLKKPLFAYSEREFYCPHCREKLVIKLTLGE